MGRSSVVVLVICMAAFAAALLGTTFIASAADRSGRSVLTATSRDLLDALQAPRVDRERVAAHLAPGVSLDDPRVEHALASVRSALARGRMAVFQVRVSDGGAKGETDLVAESSMSRRVEPDRTLTWTRDPGGRWGLVPVSR